VLPFLSTLNLSLVNGTVLDATPSEFLLLSPFEFQELISSMLFSYSTNETRAEGGMKAIEEMIKKLEKRHMQHIEVYGSDNDLRLTGRHETGHIGSFSSGVADRGSSIRIPKSVAVEGKGYFEDRRPASNIDPYQVCEYVSSFPPVFQFAQ